MTVMTIRSLFLSVVSNRDFLGKMAKIGLYLVSILRKSTYYRKKPVKKKITSIIISIILKKISPAALSDNI